MRRQADFSAVEDGGIDGGKGRSILVHLHYGPGLGHVGSVLNVVAGLTTIAKDAVFIRRTVVENSIGADQALYEVIDNVVPVVGAVLAYRRRAKEGDLQVSGGGGNFPGPTESMISRDAESR